MKSYEKQDAGLGFMYGNITKMKLEKLGVSIFKNFSLQSSNSLVK